MSIDTVSKNSARFKQQGQTVSNIYKTTSGHLRPKNETSNSSVKGLLLRCCSMTKVTDSLRLLTLLRPVLLRHFGFTLWVQAF